MCGEDRKPTAAIVNVKGTGYMERTDSNGHFRIRAPKKGVLLIGYNGKPTIEMKVKPTLEVVLKDKWEQTLSDLWIGRLCIAAENADLNKDKSDIHYY